MLNTNLYTVPEGNVWNYGAGHFQQDDYIHIVEVYRRILY